MLPDSEGLSTLESVAERAPHLPIVVLTGRTDAGLGPRAIQEGAQDYLTKGRITVDVLRRTLRYAVDRHEKQRELVHANHRLSLLNSIVRQDVRDDVSTVVGWGEALRDSAEPADEELAAALLDAAEHALDLTETASELVALLSTDAEPDLEPIDVHAVVEEEANRLRGETEVDLVVDRSGDDVDPTVRGTHMLSSAIEQLFENAVRHNDHERPSVRVEIERAENAIHLEVADDGIGIPRHQRQLLNDPEARYGDRSGIGTGLYLVTNVLDQLGGTIEFAPNRPRGTVATVMLPRASDR
jgi:signal transduction histidine kinase